MKVILNENQIKNLLRGYKTLNEQTATTPTGFDPTVKTETIDFEGLWDSGKWKMTATQITSLKTKLGPLVKFLQSNPTAKVNIEIQSGESQVTNFDREKSGCAKGVYTDECKVDVGVLSNNRAQQMYDFLLKYFQDLKTNGVIKTMPNTPTKKTIIGTNTYTPNVDNPTDPKYKKEQFVRLNITGTATYDCLIGMKITVSYKSGEGHSCDEAIFGLKVNQQLLGIVNLNNGVYDANISTPPGAPQIRQIIHNYNKRLVITTVREINTRVKQEYNQLRAEKKIRGPLEYKINAPEIGVEGKTLQDLGLEGWNAFYQYAIAKYIELNDFEGKVIFSPEAVIDDAIIEKFRGWSQYKGRTMGDVNANNETHMALKNLEGRKSDGKQGGSRSQTFTLDTSKAQAIVQNAEVKDRLIITLVPMVDKTGPYSFLYNDGSHSEVPTVKIEGKDGDIRYNKTPNKSMERGSMQETDILQTDLCGNELPGGN